MKLQYFYESNSSLYIFFTLYKNIAKYPLNVNSINNHRVTIPRATPLFPFHFCHNTVERIDDRRLHESGGTRTKAGSLY